MLKLQDIHKIFKIPANDENSGYYIEFTDGQKIHITKRRCIPALFILIKYGVGTEKDLAGGELNKINELRQILKGRIPSDLFQNQYGDANKPYSELWNEEGFTWIGASKELQSESSSQEYILNSEDHNKFFGVVKKANRKPPSKLDQQKILNVQERRCNLCGSPLLEAKNISKSTFCRDRRRLVFDHRTPIQKNGRNDFDNYQALCFYCNKSKWQRCQDCHYSNCNPKCALVKPEEYSIISPTNEDISELIFHTRSRN